MSTGQDMNGSIGVGVVGLSARGGWGAGAHLPAMVAAGGFELRGLVASSDEYVGEVLSTTVLSAVSEWGSPVSAHAQYTLDRDQGATMLGIGFGHAIDPVLMVTGELRDVVATTAVRHPYVPLGRTGQVVRMTADDQIAISGSLPGGAVLSAHQRGGISAGPGFSMTIDGTEGTLEASAADHPHIAPLTVRGRHGGGRMATLRPPAAYDAFPSPAGTAIHTLAHAYAGIRSELRGGAGTVPDFTHAVRRHRLLAAISESAATGRRVEL